MNLEISSRSVRSQQPSQKIESESLPSDDTCDGRNCGVCS